MGNLFRSNPNIIFPMTIILCRFEGPYRQGDQRGPHQHRLINPTFLRIFDDMLYRLPFPNALHLERILKRNEVLLAGNAEFLSSIRSELHDDRALVDFERGWKRFWRNSCPQVPRPRLHIPPLHTETAPPAPNLARQIFSQRLGRPWRGGRLHVPTQHVASQAIMMANQTKKHM
jgi:hypothetical protein